VDIERAIKQHILDGLFDPDTQVPFVCEIVEEIPTGYTCLATKQPPAYTQYKDSSYTDYRGAILVNVPDVWYKILITVQEGNNGYEVDVLASEPLKHRARVLVATVDAADPDFSSIQEKIREAIKYIKDIVATYSNGLQALQEP